MVINQPSNQIRLTNVSLVRIKKGKKRYEIACYKNKVLEWRSGQEKDLDNVLQIPAVFFSVNKGQVASGIDLENAFGAEMSANDIILEILNKGELQVGEKERQAQLERVHNEVIDIVAGKVVDPRTKRVYTAGMIEKALAELSSQGAQSHQQQHQETKSSPSVIGTTSPADSDPSTPNEPSKAKPKDLPTWTGVVTTRSAKSQALDAMKALIAHQPIPVARARMRLRITCPTKLLGQSTRAVPNTNSWAKDDDDDDNDDNNIKTPSKDKSKHKTGAGGGGSTTTTIKDRLLTYVETVESQDMLEDEWEAIGFVEPGAFKLLGDFLAAETKGRGRLEVLDMAVVHMNE